MDRNALSHTHCRPKGNQNNVKGNKMTRNMYEKGTEGEQREKKK